MQNIFHILKNIHINFDRQNRRQNTHFKGILHIFQHRFHIPQKSIFFHYLNLNFLCCFETLFLEADAFQSFCMLMFEHMPAYFSDNISGVYNGTHVCILFVCMKTIKQITKNMSLF